MDRTGVAVCGWIVERQDRRRSRNRRDGKNIGGGGQCKPRPDRGQRRRATGLVDDGGLDPEDRQRIENMAVGSVPFLKAGEAIGRVAAGPDEQARKYESQLEGDVAAALNIPLSDLKSDYSSGSFSNLRMAWVDAERELSRRRTWWHRNYRLPIYLTALSDSFAAGRLPRMTVAVMAALKRPSWRGPKGGNRRNPRKRRSRSWR